MMAQTGAGDFVGGVLDQFQKSAERQRASTQSLLNQWTTTNQTTDPDTGEINQNSGGVVGVYKDPVTSAADYLSMLGKKVFPEPQNTKTEPGQAGAGPAVIWVVLGVWLLSRLG